MSKKNRFLFLSVLLTFFLTLTPGLSHYALVATIAFTAAGLVIAAICLWSDLEGLEFVTLLTLPAVFCLGMVSLLFNFPNFSLFFRLLFFLIFLVFYYSLLLALNVFNVARQKAIPLLRAAYTVSFLITIFSSLPIFTLLYKSDLGLTFEILIVFFISLALSFQSLWTVFLPEREDLTAFKTSAVLSLMMAETALVFSFFPLESFFRSLTLAAFFYIYLGFAHQFLRKTLSARNIIEYTVVGLVVVALVVLF